MGPPYVPRRCALGHVAVRRRPGRGRHAAARAARVRRAGIDRFASGHRRVLRVDAGAALLARWSRACSAARRRRPSSAPSRCRARVPVPACGSASPTPATTAPHDHPPGVRSDRRRVRPRHQRPAAVAVDARPATATLDGSGRDPRDDRGVAAVSPAERTRRRRRGHHASPRDRPAGRATDELLDAGRAEMPDTRGAGVRVSRWLHASSSTDRDFTYRLPPLIGAVVPLSFALLLVVFRSSRRGGQGGADEPAVDLRGVRGDGRCVSRAAGAHRSASTTRGRSRRTCPC